MNTRIIPSIYHSILQPAFDFIFPRTCHLCGSRLTNNCRHICPTCIARLPRTNYHRMDFNPMEQRLAGKFPFERATGYFFYAPDTEMASLIHDFKYRHYRGLAETLGEIIAKELMVTPFFSDVDTIIPVPMHILKKARRGYNQTEELARGISNITGIPIIDNLKATKPHRSQTRLTHAQRLDNLTDTFTLVRPESLADRHILLLDDVCTTGATLTACADTLLSSAPSLRISLLTLSITS